MSVKSKPVKKNKWTTIEKFVNAKGTVFFREPEAAKIRICCIGIKRQKKTLDGINCQKLTVDGFWTVLGSKIQIKVPNDTTVFYEVYRGDVSVNFPPVYFYSRSQIP